MYNIRIIYNFDYLQKLPKYSAINLIKFLLTINLNIPDA